MSMEHNLDQKSNTVPCCECGFTIQPNSSNMCVKCLRSKNDITLGLPNKLKLVYCPKCKFYSHPSKSWLKLESDSTLLQAFCKEKLESSIKSNKVRLVRAETIPSVPNSKKIKIRFYVQKEFINGETLQQSYVVEFVQHNHVCEFCTRAQPQANPHQWVYVVQLRRPGCRSFLHLEQVILKNAVAANAVKVLKMKHDIDFAFAKESCAEKFVDFIKARALVRISESKGLVSHDPRSNYSCFRYTCFRYTFFVEVCPIFSEDLILLPPKVVSSLGNISPVVICTKVTDAIALFDPLTSVPCNVYAETYWREPFKSLRTRKELVEYVVLNIHEVYFEVTINGKKFGLANAEVAPVKDLGKNDTRFNIKTHLGYLLKNGDYALGYDLCGINCSDNGLELNEHIGGGVILMKKKYEGKRRKRRAVQQSYLKELEEITNEVYGMSLGGEEPTLEEKLGGLNLSGEEYKEKKKARSEI